MRETTSNGTSSTQRDVDATLKERARRFAAPLKHNTPVVRATHVGVRVSGDMYAIRTDALERVFAIQHLTPLARAPRFVRGVLSLDGRIVAAIDIRRLCGRDGEAGATRQYGALIAGAGSECVVLVDAVMGLRSFADADIHAAAEGESKHRAGVTRDGVAVLDVGWLLRTCVQLAA